MAKRITYIFIFLLVLNFLTWFVTILKFISYPYSIDFGEGILLVQSVMISNGENIYPSINDYPYIVSNYHPFFPFLNSIFYHFTEPGLWSGRLISFLSAMGSMVIAGYIVFRSTKKVEFGLLAGLLPLCLSYPYNWSLTYRVDYLGIFLTLLGLYLYMYPPKRGGILISIIPFTLAFFTKMNFALAPFACLIDLFSKKDPKKQIYLIALVISIGIPYLILNLATNWGMYLHTFIYTANQFYPDRMIEGYREILQVAFLLIAVVFIGLVKPGGNYKILLGSYVGLLLLSLVTYGAEGSDSNYYIELIFALSVAGILWLPGKENSETHNNRIISHGLLVALVILFTINARLMHSSSFIPPRNFTKSLESGRQIDMFVKTSPGEVISEDATFLGRNGKEMLFQPYIMSLLSRKGKWNQSKFVEDLANQRFSLIILRFDVNNPNHSDQPGAYQEAGFDRFTVEMENAIRDNYQALQPIPMLGNSWYMYIPKINEN